MRSRGGASGEHVVAAELEHEVEKVVVAERGAGLGLEGLGRKQRLLDWTIRMVPPDGPARRELRPVFGQCGHGGAADILRQVRRVDDPPAPGNAERETSYPGVVACPQPYDDPTVATLGDL